MSLNTNIGPERVQVFAKPLGSVQVPGFATSVTGFLISTTEVGAPVNTPISVTTLSDFETTFGGPDECGEQYYAIQGYFDNAGTGATAIIVNVGSAPTAADYIGSATDSSGLRAFDAEDVLGLVCIPSLPLEDAYLVQSALIDYTETVRTEFGATLSTSFSILSMPKEISKADSDVQVYSGKFLSSAGTGPFTVVVEDTLGGGTADLSALTPGMILTDASGSFTAVVSNVDDGTDTITIATDPSGSFVAGNDVLVKIPSAVTYKETVINNPSKTAAWYFNNVTVLDRSTAASPGDIIAVDPSGHVAGVMARIDANTAIGGVSHAPAGIQFAGLAGIQGLSLALSERIDAEPLRLNFINRLTSFPGAGSIIFGGYTSDSGTSPTLTADEQLIQVIRSVQFIKGSLERGLRAFLWENFSPDTQSQVESAILSFLRNNSYLFPAGLPESEQFKVIRVEATQDDLDIGLLKVRVQIKPNKAVRFIEVDLEFPLPTA